MEELSPYVFIARWQAGKDLPIPDALSRHPVTNPHKDNDTFADISVPNIVALRPMSFLIEVKQHPSKGDFNMEELQQAAQSDDPYTRQLECVRHEFPRNCYNLHSTLLPD